MGGAETLVKDYALLLDKDRFDVVVLCIYHVEGSPWEKILAEKGVRLIFAEDRFPRWLLKGRRPFSYGVVKSMIREERPDIIHAHLFMNTYLRRAQVPESTFLIYTVHNDPDRLWSDERNRREDRFRKRDLRDAKWLVRTRSMQLVALHGQMKCQLQEIFGTDNIIVLKNGIDFRRFENPRPKEEVRRELDIPPDAFLIGNVGRFALQKNHLFLVDVFREVLARRRDAFLLLIGKGVQRPAVEERLAAYGIESRCRILDNRDDIPDLLHAMDCYVFPSEHEGLPVSLIEAQKAGLPCYVSDRISDESFVSGRIQILPIDRGATCWAEAICEGPPADSGNSTLDQWDMNQIIRKLEEIYINGCGAPARSGNRKAPC